VRTCFNTSDVSLTLASLAAECLKIPVSNLSPNVPLVNYGLDSLATEELTAAIELTFGRRVHDSILFKYPDLESLERYLASSGEEDTVAMDVRELMNMDANLPDDIRPINKPSDANSYENVLLSGATGFLGAHILQSLLKKTSAKIFCIVRSASDKSALKRIKSTMNRFKIWDPAFEPRLKAVEGDLALPQMGIAKEIYATLCETVDAIYHCAATVNWIYPYAALRQVNVLGTNEILRFACTSPPKPLHFISSAAVCHSTWGPLEVHENSEVYPYIHGLHLGYAQSKCVAESLVRQAGDRGLSVTIHRPSLIAGSRVSGVSNLDDLLSRLIKGIILMKTAPDLDWSVDCCPVDYVADAIMHLTTKQEHSGVSHLVSPAPRHWRELVLWINFFGYPVRLLPYRVWLEQLRAEATYPGHPLRSLLSFFTKEPEGEGGLTLPELYEDSKRSRIDSFKTRTSLQGGEIGSPGLNAHLLDRYFRQYIEEGFLPPATSSARPCNTTSDKIFDAGFFTTLMRQFRNSPELEVHTASPVQNEGAYSIISELSSWKHGSIAGINRYQLTVVDSEVGCRSESVIVKKKSRDEHLIETAEQIAGLCSDKLGQAFKNFGGDIGLSGSHLREIGIYQQKDERFKRHSPALYGALRDDSQELWALVLEDISGLEMLNTVENITEWRHEHIEAAIRDLAELHAIWYRRENNLRAQPWLGRVVSACRREEMYELWDALAEHAEGRFGHIIGSSARKLQRSLISEIGSRWRSLEQMPRTLIHNDFNSRNIAFRREGDRLQLCAYDWELATLGVPQHDLAELLCFVLKPDAERAEIQYYLDLHRSTLEKASSSSIDSVSWETGFRLSLHDLLVDRFAMYVMVDRFCPQRFLTRVVSTWHALYDLFPLEEVGLS